jgi:hypothetical protein
MKKYLGAVLLICLFIQCKNDIEINAPWIETPVVFGLLDPNSNTQFIRIQKTYQNSISQNTQQGAQYPDSLYFDTLVVKVTSTSNEIFSFIKVPAPKESGFFTKEDAFIYTSNFRPRADGRVYTLEIFSPRTGKTYRGRTLIMGVADTAQVPSGLPYSIRLRTDSTSFFNVRFKPGVNTFVYDISVRLRYTEFNVNGDSAQKSVEFPILQNLLTRDISTNEFTRRIVSAPEMLSFFRSELLNLPNATRKFRGIDYVFAGGSQDLKLFIDISRTQNSFVQNRPEFSNIDDGLGIFSSRSMSTFSNVVLADKASLDAINSLPGFTP